jgi:hypothetical protein
VLSGRVCVLFLLAGPVHSQSVRVVSEFQRIDPFGEVVRADRTTQPREILSPEVARNAFASFHIAVTVAEREPFFVYVQTNPSDIFHISLYKELYAKTDAGWIPDVLQPVQIPAFDTLPYLPLPIPGQNTVSYWMDLWVPAETPVERVRLEVLVKVGRGWVEYPMEVRVMEVVAPSIAERHATLPAVTARADASVYGPFRDFACDRREGGHEKRLSVRLMIHRNAVQDLALARAREGRAGDPRAELLSRAGVVDRKHWCQSPGMLAELGTEWFLRVRDAAYRQAGPAPD